MRSQANRTITDDDRRNHEQLVRSMSQTPTQPQPAPAPSSGSNSDLGPYIAIAELAFGVLTVPLEVLTRHRFGERIFNVKRVFLAIMLYGAVVWALAQANGHVVETTILEGWLGRLYTSDFHADYPGLMIAFGCIWIPAAIANLVEIGRYRKRGVIWHTKSIGISWFEDGRGQEWDGGTDWKYYRFYEPLGWLAIAIAVYQVNWPFGIYLIAAAVGLFIRNNQAYSAVHAEILDLSDRTLEAQIMSGTVSHRSKKRTAGYSLVRTVPTLDELLIDPDPAPATIVTSAPTSRSGEPPANTIVGRLWRLGERPAPAEPITILTEDIDSIVRDTMQTVATRSAGTTASTQPVTGSADGFTPIDAEFTPAST